MKDRRSFIKSVGLSSLGLALTSKAMAVQKGVRILGANEVIRVAVVGVRSRAKALSMACHNLDKVKIVYNCDVDAVILDEHQAWCEKNLAYLPKVEKDFRKLIEKKDIDAVIIATPEHWHAPMSIMAMEAGKHVYVEKPCSHNAHEGELLVKAQQKYGKVCQMGNQQRSAASSRLAIKEISEGIIGDVYKGKAYYSNSRQSIGKGKVITPPKTLDWDLWQGPAPREAFRDNIHPYNWHWFRTWGTGEIHNNATHEVDICRWALGVKYPVRVSSVGGKYMFEDDWEFCDNQDVTYEFEEGKYIQWEGHSRNVLQPNVPGRGATIYGSKGSIMLDRNFYRLYDLNGKLIKEVLEKEKSATLDTAGAGGLDISHVKNFMDTIRGLAKEQHSPIDDANISTHLCHLGNIAQDLGHSIAINPENGRMLEPEPARHLWSREYEPGWELKV